MPPSSYSSTSDPYNRKTCPHLGVLLPPKRSSISSSAVSSASPRSCWAEAGALVMLATTYVGARFARAVAKYLIQLAVTGIVAWCP